VQRRLTDWKTGLRTFSFDRIFSFDISPDGKQIVFDRVRDSSDIVLMDLKN
jgi:hypothetical protein